MSDMNGFPKISIGHCDGMGCGHGSSPCWCEESYAMKMNFQKKHQRPWNNDDPICQAWEDSFRATDQRWRMIIKEADTKKALGGISEFMFAISWASIRLREQKKL